MSNYSKLSLPAHSTMMGRYHDWCISHYLIMSLAGQASHKWAITHRYTYRWAQQAIATNGYLSNLPLRCRVFQPLSPTLRLLHVATVIQFPTTVKYDGLVSTMPWMWTIILLISWTVVQQRSCPPWSRKLLKNYGQTATTWNYCWDHLSSIHWHTGAGPASHFSQNAVPCQETLLL